MDSLVTIKSYASRPEADIAKGFLESKGIKAIIFSDDAGGSYPMAFSSGVELKVSVDYLEKAKQILMSKFV